MTLILTNEAAKFLPKEKFAIQMSLAKTTGYKIKSEVMLVPILRTGLALLPAFSKTFPDAKVGFVGLKLKRDKKNFLI